MHSGNGVAVDDAHVGQGCGADEKRGYGEAEHGLRVHRNIAAICRCDGTMRRWHAGAIEQIVLGLAG